MAPWLKAAAWKHCVYVPLQGRLQPRKGPTAAVARLRTARLNGLTGRAPRPWPCLVSVPAMHSDR
jgi:hypothetical protein